MSLNETLFEEDARPMGASAMRSVGPALNPNVGYYEPMSAYGKQRLAPPIHGYGGGSYPTGLAAVAPASGCRSCMQPVPQAAGCRGCASPAISLHGYQGGSYPTGIAAVMPSYDESPLAPGGSYPTGLASMQPVQGWRDQAYPLQAAALTYSDACAQAGAQLCALSSAWCGRSCADIAAHVQADPTLFVCTSPNSAAIRCALAPGSCTPAQCGTTTDNTLLYVGIGVVALLAVAIVAKNLRPRHHVAVAPVKG